MAEDIKIVDNSVEMDPNSDAFKAMLAGKPAPVEKKQEKVEVKADVKDVVKDPVKESPSSGETEPKDEPEGDAEETADTLKKQIAGLKAELTKRKGQHEKVEKLEKDLSSLQAELKASQSKGEQTEEQKLAEAVSKLDHDAIIEKRIEFEDELADGRANLKLAERDGDVEAQKVASNQILRARKVLKALDKGREELAKRTQDAEAGEKDFTKKLTAEVDGIFADALELHPSLKDTESPLFKAGDAEFRKRPLLMKAMGQSMGELVSLAYAILRNPELVGGKSTKAAEVRKDLVKNLDEGISKAFHKGGGAAGTKATPNYAEVAETDMASFEKMVAKAKGQ